MNWRQLQQRIARWENLHTEFKEWPVHNDAVAASLVAFANTDGGQFILGVDKTGEITGIDEPDAVMQRIDQIAYNNCEPPLTTVQETVTTDARDETDTGAVVVVVNIPKGDQRPYRTNRGVYYIRTTSGWRQASRQELLRLFQATESLFYDETVTLRASLSDLSVDAFENFVRQAYQRSIQDFLGGYEQLLINCVWLRALRASFTPILRPYFSLAESHSVSSRGYKSSLLAFPEATSAPHHPTKKRWMARSRRCWKTLRVLRSCIYNRPITSRTLNRRYIQNCRPRRCGRRWSMPWPIDITRSVPPYGYLFTTTGSKCVALAAYPTPSPSRR